MSRPRPRPDWQPSFLGLDDYLAQPRPPQTWLVDPILPVGGLCNLFGAPKVSKSFAALGLAEAVGDLSRVDWLGLPVRHHGQVLYLQLDTPRSLWADRLYTLRAAGHRLHGVALADRESQGVAYPWNILSTACENWLREQVAYHEPALVVYDTVRQLHPADENDNSIMAGVVSRLVAATQPAAVLIVSHTRKENLLAQRRPAMVDEGRGANFLSSVCDGLMLLTGRDRHHRKLRYVGRATDETTLYLAQDARTGLHQLQTDPIAEAVGLGRSEGLQGRALARHVAATTGVTEEAARSAIRRRQDGEGGDA